MVYYGTRLALQDILKDSFHKREQFSSIVPHSNYQDHDKFRQVAAFVEGESILIKNRQEIVEAN